MACFTATIYALARCNKMNEFFHSQPGFEEAEKHIHNNSEPELTLSYDVKQHDFVHAGGPSSEIKSVLKKLAVDPVILRRIAIATYEAEINVVAHSLGGKMVADIYPTFIKLTFQDNGPGLKDIQQAMVPGWSTATNYIREMGFGAGLGLPNIKKNSDALYIKSAENSSTTLKILVYIKK